MSGRLLVLIHVHFVEGDLAVVLLRELIDDWHHRLARTAPWSPEVEEDRDLGAEDFRLEFCVGEGESHGEGGDVVKIEGV